MNFTDWSEEITKNLKQAQEQYWKSLAEQRAKAESYQATDIPNMTESMERLWSFISPQMPKQADDVMQQFFGMGNKRHDQFTDNYNAMREMVDSLVESQLHSFGIPTKKDQEDLLKKIEELTLQNEILKERIEVLEADAEKHEQAAPEKEFKATATRVSKPAGVKKVAKSASKVKPISTPKAKPVDAKQKQPSKTAATTKPSKAKTAAPTKKPAVKKKPANKAQADDLGKIKGIGPIIKQKLADAGIKTFDQLAALTTTQAQTLDDQLGLNGRLLRDDWAGQAAILAAAN